MTTQNSKIEEVKAVCPECGSDQINEMRECDTVYPVKRWLEEDGYVYPDGYYSSYRVPNGNCRICTPMYQCAKCGNKFNSPDVAEEEEE